MFTQVHEEALSSTPQFGMALDLVERLDKAFGNAHRIEILEAAEIEFGQLHVREHAIRVAEAAVDLASHCGFDDEYRNALFQATRVHDVGKLFMPAAILDKDGRPTETEFAIIREHARHGHELLGEDAPDMMLNVARYHHERYDGTGYAGLASEGIPIEARLVQIADVYDALRSDRAYKRGFSEEETLGKMVAGQTGRVEFDPWLLRRFVEMRLGRDTAADLSDEAKDKLSAFVESDPMDDLRSAKDISVFNGWTVAANGVRRLKETDPENGYAKLKEMRDVRGGVLFKADTSRSASFEAVADMRNDAAPKI